MTHSMREALTFREDLEADMFERAQDYLTGVGY